MMEDEKDTRTRTMARWAVCREQHGSWKEKEDATGMRTSKAGGTRIWTEPGGGCRDSSADIMLDGDTVDAGLVKPDT